MKWEDHLIIMFNVVGYEMNHFWFDTIGYGREEMKKKNQLQYILIIKNNKIFI